MRNLDHGDRDSLGLFQQRPSQGWGTPEQVQDPVYATNAFYDALVKVEGYRDLPVTDAAQRVQRSGFPLAYGDHEPEARLVASALTGYTPGGFTCHLRPAPVSQESGDDVELAPAAQRFADAAGTQVTTSAPEVVAGTRGRAVEFTLTGDDAQRRPGPSRLVRGQRLGLRRDRGQRRGFALVARGVRARLDERRHRGPPGRRPGAPGRVSAPGQRDPSGT